jgi:hypothetical protein
MGNFFSFKTSTEIRPQQMRKKSTRGSNITWWQCYKTFTEVIYNFRTKLVFVRLGWKSLESAKTVAYNENT